MISKSDIEILLIQCRLAIEAKYKGKLDDDNYFKRGFLLACKELTDEVIKAFDVQKM